MPGDPLHAAGPEQIDLDRSFPLGIAEDVPAGEDQGLALPGVDDGSRSTGAAVGVFHAEANALGDQRGVADRRPLGRGADAAGTAIAGAALAGGGAADCRASAALIALSHICCRWPKRGLAHPAIDLDAVDQRHETGNARDVELRGQGRFAVDIDAADRIPHGHQVANRGIHLPAGATLVGVEVEHFRPARRARQDRKRQDNWQ